MTIDQFISTMNEWIEKTGGMYDFTIGKDMAVNTRLTIDEEGFIWIRRYESFKRVKTKVNVSDITEFRRDDQSEGVFYVICKNNIGFMVDVHDDFYYCVDGGPSGWGTAAEHFERFPYDGGQEDLKE